MYEAAVVGEIERPPTLTDVTADKIRDVIIRGDLRPGSPLREVELSKSLNVSRGTLRAALRQLQEEDGLVEVLPHRGAFVMRLSPQKAWEIYTLRALLESYAVRLAVENKAYNDEDWQTLEALANRLEEWNQGDHLHTILKADMEFHRLMCERCNHQMLLDLLRSLSSQTFLFFVHTKLYLSIVEEGGSHLGLLNAIRRGDPVYAAEMVGAHITNTGNALFSRLKEMDWEALNVP